MDSKITKNRLSNFFAYEWIILIIVIVASIILWELIYTVSSVSLTVGQQYKIYYDETVYSKGTFSNSLKYGEEDSVLSYDVLDFSEESLTSSYNVLSTRLSVQEGDIIITDKYYGEEEEQDWNCRANNIIDNYKICTIDELYEDMGNYLKGFISEGKEINKENLDNAKITSNFLTRMKKDNRFRSDEEKISGQEQEIKRIEKLCDEYAFFSKVLEYGKENNWFYSYKKYTYLYNETESDDKESYKNLLDKQDNKLYGINIGALTGGSVNAEDYFVVNKTQNTNDLVLLVFDFLDYQPDLQFESVCVVNEMIRNLTNFKTISDFGI